MLPSASTSGRAVGSSHSGLEHWLRGAEPVNAEPLRRLDPSRRLPCAATRARPGAVRCAAMRVRLARLLALLAHVFDRRPLGRLYLLKSSAIPDVSPSREGARPLGLHTARIRCRVRISATCAHERRPGAPLLRAWLTSPLVCSSDASLVVQETKYTPVGRVSTPEHRAHPFVR